MVLRRIGNKAKLATKIYECFPTHTTYIELFFGAGGMYFNIPPPKYAFLNDFDALVFKTFKVLREHKNELYECIENIPYCKTTFKYIRTAEPLNEVEEVAWFICLSNWGFMGKPETLKIETADNKKITLANIEKTYKHLIKNKNTFFNLDFRDVFKNISFKNKKDVFVYADPPYLNTKNNYNAGVWTEKDTKDLFLMAKESPFNFGISEFESDFILDLAREYGLYINYICERRNLSSETKKIEIFITNYEIKTKLL